jgi:putative oxidoreductase
MSSSRLDGQQGSSGIEAQRYPTSARAGSYGALFLRLVLATLFVVHLYRKFLYAPMGGIHAWWGALEHNGYPVFVRVYVLSAEFAAALLLPIGLWTRWASLYAVPMMIGAALFWVKLNGYWFSDSGAEFPLLWICALLLQAILGDGAYSVGALRSRAGGG